MKKFVSQKVMNDVFNYYEISISGNVPKKGIVRGINDGSQEWFLGRDIGMNLLGVVSSTANSKVRTLVSDENKATLKVVNRPSDMILVNFNGLISIIQKPDVCISVNLITDLSIVKNENNENNSTSNNSLKMSIPTNKVYSDLRFSLNIKRINSNLKDIDSVGMIEKRYKNYLNEPEFYFDIIDVIIKLGYKNPEKVIETFFSSNDNKKLLFTIGDIIGNNDENDLKSYLGSDYDFLKDRLYTNESGYYQFLLTSKKPVARQFMSYICDDVIPKMRKDNLVSNRLSNIEQNMLTKDDLDKSLERQSKNISNNLFEKLKEFIERYLPKKKNLFNK